MLRLALSTFPVLSPRPCCISASWNALCSPIRPFQGLPSLPSTRKFHPTKPFLATPATEVCPAHTTLLIWCSVTCCLGKFLGFLLLLLLLFLSSLHRSVNAVSPQAAAGVLWMLFLHLGNTTTEPFGPFALHQSGCQT